MGDKFAKDLRFRPTGDADRWNICRRFSEAVKKYDSAEQDERLASTAWRITVDSRSWSRPTLKAVRDAAVVPEGARFTIYWSYYGADLQWYLSGQRFDLEDGGKTTYLLSGSGYAGKDRMRTEEVVRDVLGAMAKRGIDVRAADTEVSSTDSGAPQPAPVTLAPRKNAPSVFRRAVAKIGDHLVETSLAILGAVVAGLILAKAFGVGG